MLHPNVLKAANINIRNGIAAGLGIDRIAMLKYGISDIRDLYSNDFRILEQFTKLN
jgi:phenylalanyl-tRNA synthetase alpha chain